MPFKKMSQPQGLPFTTIWIELCYKCNHSSIKMKQRMTTLQSRPLFVEVFNPYCINCRLDSYKENMS